MALNVVNENSTCWLTIQSFDREGDAEVPVSFTWDLHDTIDGTPLSTNNSEAPGSSTVVMITYTLNDIRHDRPYERRVVTVTETFGDGEQLVGEHYYLIKNLYIPTSMT